MIGRNNPSVGYSATWTCLLLAVLVLCSAGWSPCAPGATELCKVKDNKAQFPR